MSKFDFGVFIGRFQPLHIGHERIIRDALSSVDRLIVVVGSSNSARTPINPFTFAERAEMIRTVFAYEVSVGQVIILAAEDHPDDEVWAEQIRDLVKDAVLDYGNNHGIHLHGTSDFKIALAGYGKDSSSFYLKMFPEWGSIQLETQHGTINASDIRADYLRRLPRFPRDAVNDKVLKWLVSFSMEPEFRELVNEAVYYEEYPKKYRPAAYLTADSLVLRKGKILLVTRGKTPGKGLLAMPGGFVNFGERFLDASIRELREETHVIVTKDDLVDRIIGDNPKRSQRGRVISIVNVFDLSNRAEDVVPIGADDAIHAAWYDFDTLNRSQFFDDHYDLIAEYLEK